MSKKLIAVASAAALAITAFVGAPAFAAPAAAITDSASGAGTSSSPYVTSVVSANTVVANTNALTYTVSGLATGDVVRVSTTGAWKILESVTGLSSAQPNVKVASLGSNAWTDTVDSDDDVVLVLFTTDTVAATAVLNVTRTGLSSSSTLHIKGAVVANSAYDISDVQGAPATLAEGATATVTFVAKDTLGNIIENSSNIVGDTGTSLGAVTWNSSTKRYETVMTSTSSTEFLYSLDATVTTVVGYAAAKDNFKGVVNNAGVSAQITALTAQVTALTADYNALAKKWNKRVASGTAPKKKAALK
jgi:hypothetical protein